MSLESAQVARVASKLAKEKLRGRESDFLQRVYSGGLTRYITRLEAIEFSGVQKVLDAGAGYGQWALALSQLNQCIFALEYDKIRSYVSKRIFESLENSRIRVINGSITNIPFESNYFDAIFSYSVVYQTRWQKTLREFDRVLKPGGKLYFSANSLGWSLYNLVKNPNLSSNFSPRQNALKACIKTVSFGKLYSTADWILFPKKVRQNLLDLGFKSVVTDGDGQIRLKQIDSVPAFYETKYCGLTNVFEILAIKHG